MAQGKTKGLQAKQASGGRKTGGNLKKGARAIPPKSSDRMRQATAHKKLSAKINNHIEQQMVSAASVGKLTIMKNTGGQAAGKGKGKEKA